jgi:hypothetical protein
VYYTVVYCYSRSLEDIVVDGMTVDPLWDSIVTSGNLPVRKLRGSLGATRDTKSGTNYHHDED